LEILALQIVSDDVAQRWVVIDDEHMPHGIVQVRASRPSHTKTAQPAIGHVPNLSHPVEQVETRRLATGFPIKLRGVSSNP
jgi:hypothetical protein